MKKKKYLPLYEKWMDDGILPQVSNYYTGGLCGAGLAYDTLFDLMKPQNREAGSATIHYWGHDGGVTELSYNVNPYAFTPLRQTILLFLAAMNDEL